MKASEGVGVRVSRRYKTTGNRRYNEKKKKKKRNKETKTKKDIKINEINSIWFF